MPIASIEFAELEKKIKISRKPALHYLAPKLGVVYVVAVTRDNCPACKRQKLGLNKLASDVSKRCGQKAVFVRLRVRQPPGNTAESLRAKDLFGHYFYPTVLILMRTKDKGAIEFYRSVSPGMSELKRKIETAVETATMLKEQNC
jgi:hypothetical protein